MNVKRAFWLLGFCALSALFAGPKVWHHFNLPKLLHPGDRLTGLGVSTLSYGNYVIAPDGHPKLINVFATWCVPCREEAPGFAAAARHLRASGVEVIGIDQEESPSQVKRFITEFSLRYPVYVDDSGVTHDVLGARVIPTTIYVDSAGVIRWMHSGPIDERDLEAFADALSTRV